MIIFGTRGVTTTPERGDFHCPSCNAKQGYGKKRVRRFFTLYFIPLIPLDKLGEYVECATCKDTYKTTVLDYDPDQQAQEVEAEYHSAIKKVMIHVLLADGVIDDAEVDTAREVYRRIAEKPIDNNALREEITAIQSTGEDLSTCLSRLQGCLNDEGKELVMKAALQVAMADGEIQQEEQELLARIGGDLGMSKAHVKGVVDEVLESA